MTYVLCQRPLTARKWVPGRPVQRGGYSDSVAGGSEYLNIPLRVPFHQCSKLYFIRLPPM
jgi:hypothetical protein